MEPGSGPYSDAARRYRASLRRVYESGRARIEPIPGVDGGWRLSFIPWGSSRPIVTTHRRLSSAWAWAAHYERVSIRRANRVRHGLIAVAFTILALAMIALLTMELAWWGVVVFVVGAGIWFLGLHELADLLDAVVPDEESDTVDRRTVLIDAWIEGIALAIHRTARAGIRDAGVAAVPELPAAPSASTPRPDGVGV